MIITQKLMSFVIIGLVIFTILILKPQDAISQETKTQQPTPEQMMNMMGPMMGKMMETMLESMLTTMAKPQSAQRLATFAKNYYDALVAKGFSKEDALKIVTSTGMPSVPAMK